MDFCYVYRMKRLTLALRNAAAYFHKHWTAKAATRHFQNSNYGRVLKAVKAPLSMREPWAIYLNVFRLIALRETGQDSWLAELGRMNTENQFDAFNKDEKNYIFIHLLDRLFGEIDIQPYIALKNVSEATRATFPVDPRDPKFRIFFERPKRPRHVRFENYIWLANPRKRPAATIRFSNNFQNHKLFCLGKGSSFFSK